MLNKTTVLCSCLWGRQGRLPPEEHCKSWSSPWTLPDLEVSTGCSFCRQTLQTVVYIELSMVFTRIRVQQGCFITVTNQCYSFLTRIAITIRFASPLALLMARDPSEGAVQFSSHFRILVVCSGFEIVQSGVIRVR